MWSKNSHNLGEGARLVQQPGSFPTPHCAKFGTTKMGFKSYHSLFSSLWHQRKRHPSYIWAVCVKESNRGWKTNSSFSTCQVPTSTIEKKAFSQPTWKGGSQGGVHRDFLKCHLLLCTQKNPIEPPKEIGVQYILVNITDNASFRAGEILSHFIIN